ncbi:TonB family protein [Thalassovita aquimarina]|uniref:TonB family protein n=1 Tax=Thalassovita aquimarina TaxID=2785917 RepID=A0ABS5HVY9_9RHOB|nr:TonB family protein [Thalassovita aquimarina]MBR9653124.1 TonB family protein [Thalassovita aquimarina]
MKPVVEFIGFLGLSVAAHLAFWQGTAGGVHGSAGEEGMASVTVIGGTPALQALVAEWDRSPELDLSPVPAGLPVPDATRPAPVLSARQAVPVATPPAAVPLASGTLPVLPRIDDATPPAPLSRLAPETSPRPKPRRAQPQRPKQQAAANPAPAPAAAIQKAAGTGGRSVAGQSDISAASETAVKSSASLMSRWSSAIRARVERRKQYPGGATGQGRTQLWLRVSAAGKLHDVGIVQSSGNPAFDSAALHTVRRAALPRAPKGIEAGIYRFTLSISFTR